MRTKAVLAMFVSAFVLLPTSPASAGSQPRPGGENSPWVGVISVVVVAGVVGFLLFLANAYRRNNHRQ